MNKKMYIYIIFLLSTIVTIFIYIGVFDSHSIKVGNITLEKPLFYYIYNAQKNYEDVNMGCGMEIGCSKTVILDTTSMNSFSLLYKNIFNEVVSIGVDTQGNYKDTTAMKAFGKYDFKLDKCLIKQEKIYDEKEMYIKSKALVIDEKFVLSVLSKNEIIVKNLIKQACTKN